MIILKLGYYPHDMHTDSNLQLPDLVTASRWRVRDSEAGITDIHTRGLTNVLSADLRADNDL